MSSDTSPSAARVAEMIRSDLLVDGFEVGDVSLPNHSTATLRVSGAKGVVIVCRAELERAHLMYPRRQPNGKVRVMVVTPSQGKSTFLQRKDGTFDMNRLRMRVHEGIESARQLAETRTKVDAVSDSLRAMPHHDHVDWHVTAEAVRFTIAVPHAEATSMMDTLLAWEKSHGR